MTRFSKLQDLLTGRSEREAVEQRAAHWKAAYAAVEQENRELRALLLKRNLPTQVVHRIAAEQRADTHKALAR